MRGGAHSWTPSWFTCCLPARANFVLHGSFLPGRKDPPGPPPKGAGPGSGELRCQDLGQSSSVHTVSPSLISQSMPVDANAPVRGGARDVDAAVEDHPAGISPCSCCLAVGLARRRIPIIFGRATIIGAHAGFAASFADFMSTTWEHAVREPLQPPHRCRTRRSARPGR